MVRCPSVGIVIFAVALASCQSNASPQTSPAPGLRTSGESRQPPHSNAHSAPSPQTAQTLAMIDGRPLTWAQMQRPLAEAAGGEVLAELVVDRMLEQALRRRGLQVGPEQMRKERELLLRSLDEDADQAYRILAELRQRRGLGEHRFNALLRRNAALRLLVQDEVELSPAAVRQAYELEYGPRYEARLVVVDSLAEARRVLQAIAEGGDFTALAIEHSSDPSAAVGGLLSPISPVDASYPAAVRRALVELEVGQISDVVALERGFAILRLERIIQQRDVAFESVEDELAQRVRRRVERTLMDRQVRVLVQRADVVVFDSTLQRQWREQLDGLTEP